VGPVWVGGGSYVQMIDVYSRVMQQRQTLQFGGSVLPMYDHSLELTP